MPAGLQIFALRKKFERRTSTKGGGSRGIAGNALVSVHTGLRGPHVAPWARAAAQGGNVCAAGCVSVCPTARAEGSGLGPLPTQGAGLERASTSWWKKSHRKRNAGLLLLLLRPLVAVKCAAAALRTAVFPCPGPAHGFSLASLRSFSICATAWPTGSPAGGGLVRTCCRGEPAALCPAPTVHPG